MVRSDACRELQLEGNESIAVGSEMARGVEESTQSQWYAEKGAALRLVSQGLAGEVPINQSQSEPRDLGKGKSERIPP
ncbi:hypothetical protein SKAU_G00355920 [Synaphobranchus kaupii]|uniref:Uncharacterized protein n=1 Tax=Synaphobranchus kaupii TaxID=118154 RepID=A0A9Q1IGL4_SYNKA|nr:hypothetical protein SKAU_G00355920 [Synaphobranchus kaupii]